MLSLSNAVAVFGLSFDIVGAFFLAQGFVAKDLHRLTFEGTSGFGSPPNLRYIRSTLLQRAEARIGFTVLAVGFLMQAVGIEIQGEASSPRFAWWMVSIAAVVLATTALLIGSRVKRVLFRRSGKTMAGLVLSSGTFDVPYTIKTADSLLPELERETDEADSNYATRVLRYLEVEVEVEHDGITSRSS